MRVKLLSLTLLASLAASPAGLAAESDWPRTVQEMQETAQIHAFYDAFARGDADAMLAQYAPDVEFSDPVFGTLDAAEARAMWRMLIARANGQLRLMHHFVKASQDKGEADWEAWYPFSATGNFVHNTVHAEFQFKNGKIWRHHDSFDFAVWACQALAPAGCWFGGQPSVQGKIRDSARQSLNEWIKVHPKN